LSGYWSSSTPSSPSKRLSISRQTSIVIPQPGELYSDISQIPPGLEVEYVEVKEEQSGIWDFLNHVMSGDEDPSDSPSQSRDPIDPIQPTSSEAPEAVIDISHLELSPRRRNSVGGSSKKPHQTIDTVECSTPVQEEVSQTPLLTSIQSTSKIGYCILCGKKSQTVHDSRSRSRSV
jgi:hypothetical protein